jgi:DNA-binding NarL/FixJ family response regulator
MRFLVADRHPLYREAACAQLRRRFPDATIEEISTVAEFVGTGSDNAPYDLILIGCNTPGGSVSGIVDLVTRYKHTPIAIMSGSPRRDDVKAAIEAGARGLIPKTATADHFASAIQILLEGGTSIPADCLVARPADDLSRRVHGPSWIHLLSQRELVVLKCVVRGVSNKQISRELNLAEVTVKMRLRGIFRKIGARSRAEVAVMATKAGIG